MAITSGGNGLLIGAAIAGAAAAYMLSQAKTQTASKSIEQAVAKMGNMYPATTGPIRSRGFPDQSIKFNSLPSPMVEYLVPFDSSGRWAQVTGAYDRCDARLFS